MSAPDGRASLFSRSDPAQDADDHRVDTSGPRRLDPEGKHALFDTKVRAAPDQLRGRRENEGRHALYSTGSRHIGTVMVDCSRCQARTRTNLLELGLSCLPFSAWLPTRTHAHFLRCPGCRRYSWCRIDWTG